MFDYLITFVLAALAFVLGNDAFQKWKSGRVVWYIPAVIGSILAGLAAFVDWAGAIYLIILVLVLRMIAGAVAKRRV